MRLTTIPENRRPSCLGLVERPPCFHNSRRSKSLFLAILMRAAKPFLRAAARIEQLLLNGLSLLFAALMSKAPGACSTRYAKRRACL